MQYKGFTKQARKAMRLAENLAEKEQQTHWHRHRRSCYHP